jgi:hypothetical protein
MVAFNRTEPLLPSAIIILDCRKVKRIVEKKKFLLYSPEPLAIKRI